MNILYLSFRQVISKPLTLILSLLLVSLGVALLTVIFLFKAELEQKFEKNIDKIDWVIGAKGSPLQLILSAVYHVENPTGNMSWAEAQALKKDKLLKNVIFLAYGDSYQSFRILGTDSSYLKLYEATILEGKLFENHFEICLGYLVARKLGLKIGDEFSATHGTEGEEHEEHKYKVVGILNKTNTVIDQLILTNIESIWESHEQNEEERQITAVLGAFASNMGRLMLPNQINSGTAWQLALPALEINRLFEILGVGIEALKFLAYLLVLIAVLAIFINLYNLLKERHFEIALMRTLGASRLKIYIIVLLEGFYLSILGFFLGFFLGRSFLFTLNVLLANYHYEWSFEFWTIYDTFLLLTCIFLGFLAALLPAWVASKMDIAKILS